MAGTPMAQRVLVYHRRQISIIRPAPVSPNSPICLQLPPLVTHAATTRVVDLITPDQFIDTKDTETDVGLEVGGEATRCRKHIRLLQDGICKQTSVDFLREQR
jgi:hypothetical protein